MQETWEIWVQSLGQEDPLKEEMATHSSILAWKSQGQRSLVRYNPWSRKSQAWFSMHASTKACNSSQITFGSSYSYRFLQFLATSVTIHLYTQGWKWLLLVLDASSCLSGFSYSDYPVFANPPGYFDRLLFFFHIYILYFLMHIYLKILISEDFAIWFFWFLFLLTLIYSAMLLTVSFCVLWFYTMNSFFLDILSWRILWIPDWNVFTPENT